MFYVDYNIPLVGIYVLFGGNTNIFSGISTFFISVTFIIGISELWYFPFVISPTISIHSSFSNFFISLFSHKNPTTTDWLF